LLDGGFARSARRSDNPRIDSQRQTDDVRVYVTVDRHRGPGGFGGWSSIALAIAILAVTVMTLVLVLNRGDGGRDRRAPQRAIPVVPQVAPPVLENSHRAPPLDPDDSRVN
jgi:hypothetical protein